MLAPLCGRNKKFERLRSANMLRWCEDSGHYEGSCSGSRIWSRTGCDCKQVFRAQTYPTTQRHSQGNKAAADRIGIRRIFTCCPWALFPSSHFVTPPSLSDDLQSL